MARTEEELRRASEPTQARPSVRGRALFLGSVGVALTSLLVTQAEMVLSSVRVGYLQLPPVALGLMLVFVAIGRGLKRFSFRLGLSSSDLLVIYCMVLVAAMVSSHGVVQRLVPLLVVENYLALNTNGWHDNFNRFILPSQVPFNPAGTDKQEVAVKFYEKLPRGESIPWTAWIVPILHWGFLIFLVLFAFLCLTAILRRQWVDNEKLSFPLTQLPLEIAEDEERRQFFSNRLMWLGALLPVVVYGINGLHQIQPSVPEVKLTLLLNDYLTTPPWNTLAYTPFVLSFAAVGFFFLLPTDVLFSLWFFFLLTRVEQVAAIAYNMDTPGMPLYPPPLFVGYQTMGAYLVLVGYFVYIARPHLKKVWAAAIGRERADDADELLPYRVAVWGLLGSVVISAAWLWGMGMSLWLALFELGFYIFVIALVMARSTAEAGMLMTETTFRPVDLLRMVLPLHDFGAQNLTQLAFFDNLFLRDQRGLLLTGMLDSVKIADGTNIRRRQFVGVLTLGVVLAFVLAVALNIALPYNLGAVRMDNWMEQGSPRLTFDDYAPHFKPGVPSAAGASWQMPTFFGVGVVITLFLTAMRTAFFWWPLHPLGYALSGSWSTVEFWFPCLLAWIFKSLSLRYGGMTFYQKARPFFLGLVLGEFSIAVFYVVINLLSAWLMPEHKIPSPPFPWG